MSRKTRYLLGAVAVIVVVLGTLIYIDGRPGTTPFPVLIGGFMALLFMKSEYSRVR